MLTPLFRLSGLLTPHALRMRLLRAYMRRHAHPCTEHWAPGESEPFDFTNREEKRPIHLRGWLHRPQGTPRGTVFLLHGFRRAADARVPEAKLFAERCGLACVAWDARAHGRSDTATLTFGAQEAGDVRAALARAEQMGLPRPYIGYGSSMGGMALRYVAEELQGLILIHSPASAADVLELAPMPRLSLDFLSGFFIQADYGKDIIRRTAPIPRAERCPLILEISGEKDCYDESRMRAAFDRLPGDKAYNVFPSETTARCIRYTFPDTGHMGTGTPRSADKPEFPRLILELVDRVLNSAPHEEQ